MSAGRVVPFVPAARRRFVLRARADAPLLAGAAILFAIIAGALLAPLLFPAGPDAQDITRRLRPPVWAGGTWESAFGTDPLGRDVLGRLVFGARVSLIAGFGAVAISGPLGVLIGVCAGYFGPRTDNVLMRLTDIQLAIPRILLAIAMVDVLGSGLRNVLITLSVTGWPDYARIARGSTLAVKGSEFIEGARALGASEARIIARHVLPDLLSPLLVLATFAVANMIILEATLSFLGLGVGPQVATWGNMLNGGRLYLATAWWLTFFPGVAIFVTVLGVNLLGDYLRDRLDPQLRSGTA